MPAPRAPSPFAKLKGVRVWRACIGYSERLVAAPTQRAALDALGIKASDKAKTRFREIGLLDDREAVLCAAKTPGVVFRKLAGRSAEKWRRGV